MLQIQVHARTKLAPCQHDWVDNLETLESIQLYIAQDSVSMYADFCLCAVNTAIISLTQEEKKKQKPTYEQIPDQMPPCSVLHHNSADMGGSLDREMEHVKPRRRGSGTSGTTNIIGEGRLIRRDKDQCNCHNHVTHFSAETAFLNILNTSQTDIRKLGWAVNKLESKKIPILQYVILGTRHECPWHEIRERLIDYTRVPFLSLIAFSCKIKLFVLKILIPVISRIY